MLTDSHCHLTSRELAERIEAVLAAARAAGVVRMISVGETPADAEAALALMHTRPGIFLAAGLHPHHAGRVGSEELAALRELHERQWPADSPGARLVAVGETGLDLHYEFAPRKAQEAVFGAQLELACAVGRPVVIHARQAEQRVCEMLADFPDLEERVVFHCFGAGPEVVRRVLDRGCYVSFSGVVTFDNAEAVRKAARLVPADRIMVETDAPYLSPEPVRRQRPCEPAFVVHTARRLAELRGQAFEEFAVLTSANVERLFGLPPAAQAGQQTGAGASAAGGSPERAGGPQENEA